MSHVIAPVLFLALLLALVIAQPSLRAFLLVSLRLRREEQESRRVRRPPNSHLDAYHDAVTKDRAVGAGAMNAGESVKSAMHGLLQPSDAIVTGTPPRENHASAVPTRAVIDERTWVDLDLDQVLTELDHTSSRPGQQFLRHLLRAPALTAEPIAQLDRAVVALDRDPSADAAFRKALSGADDRRASFLVHLIFGTLPDRPGFWWVFPLMTFAAISLAASIYFWPRALIGLLFIVIINIALQLYYRPRVEALIPAIHEVPSFINAAKALGIVRSDLFAIERQTLREGVAELVLLKRATTWLRFEPSQERSELLASLYVYVNFLFLIDINAFVFALNSAKRSRPALQRMFEVIGYIDATQSIVAWRKTLPHWTTPGFTSTQKEIAATGVVHPLVKNPVANDVIIRNSSALITGSNMSGKTTFIRALGINAVLAQSVATVVATAWCAPLLEVMTSIGRSDSVLEGKSYYLAEVESVRTLIEAKRDGAQHLFLIDELFRGTNTAERVAGAYAVLEHLNRGNDIVVVATHDTELLGMLGDAYRPHHFREEISGDTLTFDFILRDGQATTRNAIALLELMKYPAELVARARNALR